jgi:RND family efflux transporter MFP subunit
MKPYPLIKRAHIILTVVTVIALLLITGCGGEEEMETEEKAKIVPVEVSEVTSDTLTRMIPLSGSIQPWKKIDIVPNVSGKLKSIVVEAGDFVEEGNLLAKLDTEPMQLQLKQAQAALSVAKASLHDAEVNVERMRKLREKNTISPQMLEKAELAYESAQANYNQAKSNLDLSRYNLKESIMRAPFSGYITSKNADEGDNINTMTPGQSVVTLMKIKRLKISGNVSYQEISAVKEGMPVIIKVDSHPDSTFKGEVFTVSPAADVMTRSFDIQVKFENQSLTLLPGMFARLWIISEKRVGVPAIPLDAVITEESENVVFVVNGERARKRIIKTGIREETTVEVVEGLSPGEKVIVTGKRNVIDGTRVTIEGRVK